MKTTAWGKECPRCKSYQATMPCYICTKAWNARRTAAEMTGDERASEMQTWDHAVIDFGKIHQRIEELVGRSVWTHEMGSSGWPRLLEEARTWKHPDDLLAHVLTTAEEAAPGKVIPVIVGE